MLPDQRISPDLMTRTIPAERVKNGRAHLVHVAPEAQAVLRLPKIEQKKRIQIPRKLENPPAPDLLFATPIRAKLSAFSVIKADPDAAIAVQEGRVAEEAGGEPVEMPGWMFHNFRWAGVTALADAGFAPVCQRAEFLAERKAALEAWAALAGQELS